MHLHDLFESSRRPLPPSFWNWFGNSKIVDDEGNPLVVYHGTRHDVGGFDLAHAGKTDTGWYGLGIYLTAAPDSASAYAGGEEWEPKPGGNVIPCYVSIQNPYHWNGGRSLAMGSKKAVAKMTEKLKAQGYDGVVVENPFADGVHGRFFEVVAFSPSQVKSIWNGGAWSRASDHLSEDRQSRPFPTSFWRWFGRSEVVDDEGEPMPVYHGTTSDSHFAEFHDLSHFGSGGAAHDRIERTNWQTRANYFPDTANVYPVYLSIENPLWVKDSWGDDDWMMMDEVVKSLRHTHPEESSDLRRLLNVRPPLSWQAFVPKFIEIMKRAGYDGLAYENRSEDIGSISWVPLEKHQIKSIWNGGAWSRGSNHIGESN